MGGCGGGKGMTYFLQSELQLFFFLFFVKWYFLCSRMINPCFFSSPDSAHSASWTVLARVCEICLTMVKLFPRPLSHLCLCNMPLYVKGTNCLNTLVSLYTKNAHSVHMHEYVWYDLHSVPHSMRTFFDALEVKMSRPVALISDCFATSQTVSL